MSNILTVENMIFVFGIIIAGIFIINGVILLSKNKNYTCKTTGKVIDNVQHKHEDKNGHWRYYWYYLCEYNVDGIKCVRETSNRTIYKKYEVGQTVEICYDPKNCHKSYIVGDYNYKVSGIISIVLGLLAILMLLIFFI